MAFPFGVADLRAQVAGLEEMLEKHRQALHARISVAVKSEAKFKEWGAKYKDLEAAFKDLGATYKDLEAKYEKAEANFKDLVEQFNSRLLEKTKPLVKAYNEMAQGSIELLNKLQRLTDDLTAKENHIQHVEKQATKIEEDLKGEKEKGKELQETIRKNKVREDEREAYITKIYGDCTGFEEQAKKLEKDKLDLTSQLDLEKANFDKAQQERGVLSTKYDKLHSELQIIRGVLESSQTENGNLKGHIEELNARISELGDLQADLDEEKATSQGLRDQWARLQDELPRFNLSPQAALAPPPPGPNGQHYQAPQSLATELEDLGSSASASRPTSGIEPDAITRSKHFSSDSRDGSSSSSSSDDDDDDDDTEIVKIQEVIRDVHVPGPTIRIYIPYQTYAHNPIICWILVDFNTGILFRNWLSHATGRAVPFLRRIVGTQPAPSTSSSAHQPQNGVNGAAPQTASTPQTNGNAPQQNSTTDISNILGPASQNGANGSTPLAPQSGTGPSNPPTLAMFSPSGSHRGEQSQPSSPPIMDPDFEKVAELIEPVVTGEDNRETYPSGENLPHQAHVPLQLPLSSPTANIHRSNSPPVFETLFTFALHLIFYYFLYVCYEAYSEREMWRSANETTRRFMVDILALRDPNGRSLASHFFSEQVVRTMDRFVLTTASFFKIEPQPWQIPG